MAERVTGGIYIINPQSGVEGSGTRVTEAEYNTWTQDNTVTAVDTAGNTVDIVGADNKISVTDGTTTVGYENLQQPADGVGATSYSVAATPAITTTDQAAFDLQLIQIQEVNQEVQGDPIIRQILSDVQGTFNTEAELREAAGAAVADYFGIDNPLGLAAIDRAIKTITAQLPGVSQVRAIAGTASTGVAITDIVNQNNASLQDIYNVARSVALIANPALRVPLAVAEFVVGTATGSETSGVNALTNSFTTLTAATGGGGGATSGSGDISASAIATVATGVGGTYTAAYNPATGTYDVMNDASGTAVLVGLTQQQAATAAQDYSDGNTPSIAVTAPVENVSAKAVSTASNPYALPNGLPYDDNGNLNPGWTLDQNGEAVYAGAGFVEPATQASADASRQQATLTNARAQAIQQAQRKQANDGDWRVKLRLAPQAEYLYKDPGLTPDGILWPLFKTDGIIFPYMPQIQTAYHANYNAYDLTHSNYRGYFYQNSYVGEINMTAVFTAQDTKEAEYMLAVIHFFRSATKMFYGQDTAGRGSPPPLVYLQGLGEFQFNLHPCLISQFNYSLPNDVDYIRARSPNITGTNLQIKRDREFMATNPFSAALQRLASIGQPKGGINIPPAPPTLGTASPTYVPTKIEISLSLLPTQSRQQVSQQFSFQNFSNGNLLKGGFW